MRRIWMTLLALLLCVPCALAESCAGPAAAQVAADLLDAPHEDADMLMRYYIGTRVEVIREVDDTYVQVNVGQKGGSLMGYMEKRDLAFGEKAIRSVRAESVTYGTAVGTFNRLYSYPDVQAPVLDEAFDIDYKQVLGAKDGTWLHVEDGLGGTGFVYRDEIGLDADYRYADFIYTQRAEDELSYEEAIAYAKDCLLADGELANGQDNVPLTREMLDGCEADVKVMYYYDTQDVIYDITFIYTDRTWEDGFPMLCAFVELWVEGEEVVRYGYGNG